ncbi:hypothetical protein ACHAWU_001504 [Discostella pseudostelligera]|uniref:Uncharacterized protein n=1 Tax=Discostella pseudostelligera TaxID=259834 RepID=A0ABD3MKJ9_9STRA
MISHQYPCVEWGILFRPDKEGLPRYPTKEWVIRLSQFSKINHDGNNPRVRLAAHLCGSHVNNLLSSCGDSSSAMAIDDFLHQLYKWGFRRVQINATAVNGVDTTKLGDKITLQSLLRTIRAHPTLEFIIQKNDETKPLWSALLLTKEDGAGEGGFPTNIVFLHDESKGTGKEVEEGQWPTDPQFVTTSRKTVGYAGGIKPSNVKSVVVGAGRACALSGGNHFWIDMESGVRTTLLNSDGQQLDIFDVTKCFDCIETTCDTVLMDHPTELRLGDSFDD